MKTEILSKKDAKTQMRKLGILVKEKRIKVGRFFEVQNPEDSSLRISPFAVVGNGINGVGVSFVYYYRGVLTDNKMLNAILSRINFLILKVWKREYAIYVRAFGGTNSRLPSVVLKEHSAMVRYDLPGHSFKAAGGEWLIENGRLVNAAIKKVRSTSPI